MYVDTATVFLDWVVITMNGFASAKKFSLRVFLLSVEVTAISPQTQGERRPEHFLLTYGNRLVLAEKSSYAHFPNSKIDLPLRRGVQSDGNGTNTFKCVP